MKPRPKPPAAEPPIVVEATARREPDPLFRVALHAALHALLRKAKAERERKR